MRAVPTCPRCGEPLRPDVVLFGETLPESALRRSQTALDECDLFLAAGTSGTVWPAAAFVRLAAQAGARTVLVNLDAGTGSEEFDEVHLGKAEDVLPSLFSVCNLGPLRLSWPLQSTAMTSSNGRATQQEIVTPESGQ